MKGVLPMFVSGSSNYLQYDKGNTGSVAQRVPPASVWPSSQLVEHLLAERPKSSRPIVMDALDTVETAAVLKALEHSRMAVMLGPSLRPI